MSNQTPQLQQMLVDVSNIEPEVNGNLQNEIDRLQEQLQQTRDALEQKKRLLDIQKRTNQALDEQHKTLKTRSNNQEERIRVLEARSNNQEERIRVLEARSNNQEETIRVLEAQLRNYKTQNSQVTEQSDSLQLERFRSHEIELQEKITSWQNKLQIQKNRNKKLENQKKQIALELQQLEKEYSRLKEERLSQVSHSRESDIKRLQFEQEIEKSNKLTKQVKDLQRKNEELTGKLNNALNSLKQAPRAQTKIVEAPPKIVEVSSKEAEFEIKKLQAQLQELKKENAHEKEKAKKVHENQIAALKSELNLAIQAKENLKFKLAELNFELQRVKNGQQSMSEMLASSINLTSRIQDNRGDNEEERMKKNINAEEIDEESKIKINIIHKGIINALNNHLTIIKNDCTVSFLNMVASWSEEQLQRIGSNINQINEG